MSLLWIRCVCRRVKRNRSAGTFSNGFCSPFTQTTCKSEHPVSGKQLSNPSSLSDTLEMQHKNADCTERFYGTTYNFTYFWMGRSVAKLLRVLPKLFKRRFVRCIVLKTYILVCVRPSVRSITWHTVPNAQTWPHCSLATLNALARFVTLSHIKLNNIMNVSSINKPRTSSRDFKLHGINNLTALLRNSWHNYVVVSRIVAHQLCFVIKCDLNVLVVHLVQLNNYHGKIINFLMWLTSFYGKKQKKPTKPTCSCRFLSRNNRKKCSMPDLQSVCLFSFSFLSLNLLTSSATPNIDSDESTTNNVGILHNAPSH